MKNKKLIVFVLLAMVMVSCHTTGLISHVNQTQQLIWNEKPGRTVATISFGIPAMHQTVIDYKRYNKTEFNILLGEPRLVTIAQKPEGWGYYQFPTISRLANGTLHAEWSLHADDIKSYGLAAVGSAISTDGGKTWPIATPDSSLVTSFKLANSDMIKTVDAKPVTSANIKMPSALDRTDFKYRKTNFTFYKLSDMPPGVNGIYINRLVQSQTKWQLEQATINDPKGVRHSSKGLVPVIWWGDMHIMTDGSIVAGIYPAFYIKDNGQVDKQMGVAFYRSTDNGHSWSIQGRIPFQGNTKIDTMAKDRIGFTEPAYTVLADGTLLCIIRSADGDGVTNGVGNGPMYASRSTDMGKTWTTPEAIAAAGVLPRLLNLKNGVTVLSTGRPGVQLRFSKTGDNDSWTDACEMLPYESKSMELQYAVTCGYTGLLATGPNRFLLIYADFRYKNPNNEERKAIKIREVIIDPR